MTTPAKKRQKTEEGVTLHNFFTSAESSRTKVAQSSRKPSVKGKSRDSPFGTSVGIHNKASGSMSRSTYCPQEVIVIEDSDEEDIVEIQGTWKASNTQRIKRERSPSTTPIINRDGPEQTPSFGLPTSLLESEASAKLQGMPEMPHIPDAIMQPLPQETTCTPPPPDIATRPPEAPVPDHSHKRKEKPDIIDVDSLSEDVETNWQTGDDEREIRNEEEDLTPNEDEEDLVEEEDDSVRVKGRCLGEVLQDDTEDGGSCPICDLLMIDWTAEVCSIYSCLKCSILTLRDIGNAKTCQQLY